MLSEWPRMRMSRLILIGVVISVFTVWVMYPPPVPGPWSKLKAGMSRRDVFVVLGWPEYKELSSFRNPETDRWGYTSLGYFQDKTIAIFFSNKDADWWERKVVRIEIRNDFDYRGWFSRAWLK